MKTAMHEMKNTLDRINSRLKIIEEKIRKLENINMDYLNENKREDQNKSTNTSELWGKY